MMVEVVIEYMVFFDDDDMLGLNYIKYLMEGIVKGVDCCLFIGIIIIDGKDLKKFVYLIKYDKLFIGDDGVFYWFIMYINCLKMEYV